MDFFGNAFAQLGQLIGAMSSRARVTAVLLILVLVGSVAYLANGQFSAGSVYLLDGEAVSPSQWPAMVEAFARANLTDYELEGSRIRIPRGRQPAYMVAMADAGALPHNFGGSLRKSLENSSPWAGKKRQDELLKVALQDELAKIIGKMDGVDWATVMYDVQTSAGLNSKRVITASVTIKPLGDKMLTSDQVQMVRYVVAPAIGAAPESIAIVDLNGRTYPASAPGDSGAAGLDLYGRTRLDYEQRYSEQIRKMLEFITGAVVTVNVELNPEIEETESSTHVDPQPVSVEVTETTHHTNSSAPLVLGPQSGAVAQGGVNSPAVLGAASIGVRTQDQRSDRREQKVVGSQSRQVRKAGLTVKRVTVSVGVPHSYLIDVWRQRNAIASQSATSMPDAEALAVVENEIRANIQRQLLPIIRSKADAAPDAGELVTVTTFLDLPTTEIELAGDRDRVVAWVKEHPALVGCSALALVSLLLLRSIVRSAAKAAARPPHWPVVHAEAAEDDPAMPAVRPSPAGSRFRPSLHEELAGMVRDDPDAAANILRNWIGSAN